MKKARVNFKTWNGMETELANEQENIDYSAFEDRVQIMADMIGTDMQSVMDLGAGNMSLRKYLPGHICYYPVDYCKRTEDTVVCDLNKGEFPQIKTDVIFISGLLEYIFDYQGFIKWVCGTKAKEIILSYNVNDHHGRYGERIFSAHSFSCDFVNALTFHEILALFAEQGYVLMEQRYLYGNRYQPLMKFEKMSRDKLGRFWMCNGCAACQNICPSGAIVMKADIDRGYRPLIDEEQCIECGKCENVCPSLHPVYDKYKEPDTFALWGTDEERRKSSSGGAASVFSKVILERGGKVYGAAWGQDLYVKHIGIDSESGLDRLRGSKYLQSDTSNIYRQINEDLKTGKEVLFAGTPCQIAGLNNYVDEKENLYTIDLLCMGAPSPDLFKKYLTENYDISSIRSIFFRDKTLGWKSDTMAISQDGGCLYKNPENDMFEKGFHRKLFVGPVCETCQYACYPRQGDITVGDFWGIGEIDESWDDGLGTSIVMVNSSKGRALLEQSGERIQRLEKKGIVNTFNRIDDFAIADEKRDEFYKLIKTRGFDRTVENLLDNKFDVGVVCMMNHNFGNNMTNYALYRFLKDNDRRVLMIDMPTDTIMSKEWRGRDRFLLFQNMPYDRADLALQFENKVQMIELNGKCRLFLLASDQLLRDTFIEAGDYYTCMEWVSSDKFKMTYATSFGIDTFGLPRQQIEKCRYLLKRIQKMSLREDSSIEVAKKYFNIDAEQVLDPVFLCDRSYYHKMAAIGCERLPEGSFTGAYLLDPSKDKAASVLAVAQSLTGGRYEMIHSPDKPYEECEAGLTALKEPKVEEWLAMIDRCSFLITDSFHGVCFAILFHKQFAVYFTPDNWRGKGRITSILELLGLSERLVCSSQELKEKKLWKTKIDHETVEKILTEKIEKSKKWLLSTLEEGEDYIGEYDGLDLLMEHSRKYYEEIQKEKRASLKARNDLYILTHSHSGQKRKGKETRTKMKAVGFGAGGCFKRNIKKIKELYDLAYICDNDPDKWGKTLEEGVVCISPKTLREMEDVFVVIMIDDPAAAFEIAQQLMKMDIYGFDHVVNWMQYLGGDK